MRPFHATVAAEDPCLVWLQRGARRYGDLCESPEVAELFCRQMNLGEQLVDELLQLQRLAAASQEAYDRQPDAGLAYLAELNESNLRAFEEKYGLCSTPSLPT